MINPFKALFDAYRKPSPWQIATTELEDAQRSLLNSQSAQEYAKAMTAYHEERIKRLRGVIKELTKEQKKDGEA